MSLQLTELIDVDVLQKIQDAFAEMTGMAALTTDAGGKPVTRGSNFTQYCMEYTRKSEIGCKRCERCDRFGSDMTLKTGKPTSYFCHSGLIDFSCPIMAEGELIGCIIGGQVLTEKPDKEQIRRVAEEIEVDFDEYWEAIQKVPIISRNRIDKAAKFLYTMSECISQIAYGKYMAIQANREIERAASMKSDFLANMSHEIRTPMNAVIGMAEMALREDLPPSARNYLQHIKSSGRALLGIINDILDFSKIESGKMDLSYVEYEPLSLYNDVTSILETRLRDKNVELIMDVNPAFPRQLYGDNIRIRQILINLANNAVKFTNKGFVKITVDFEVVDEDNILMKVAVQDSGCGIKQEDLETIFESFQQVNSKRNRNIEGTGLGLAISQNLLRIMQGDIKVESEYEKGSTFSFSVPQKVTDWRPSIVVKKKEEIVAVGYFRNKYLAKQFFKDLKGLDIYSIGMVNPADLDRGMVTYQKDLKGKQIFLFTEEQTVDEYFLSIPERYPEITIVELVGFYSDRKADSEKWRIVRKPMSANTIALALNGEEFMRTEGEDDSAGLDFTAPEARVLIVDDNAINLTVAEGLLEPLKMKIYPVTSGKEALELISQQHFDLIFMDHMMPEMDGVETTHLIRQNHPECAETPIIALTANAVDGTKEMFLREGMNDFVAKPIEIGKLIDSVRRWLPIEKIRKNGDSSIEPEKEEDEEVPVIGNLDVTTAVKLLGSVRLYKKILKDYYKAIPKKARAITQLKQQGDWPGYTIEVHALKSLSRQIGATALADMAASLEKAGNSRDLDYIRANTEKLLALYAETEKLLAPLYEEKKAGSIESGASAEVLNSVFEKILSAADDLDIDGMEAAMAELEKFKFEGTAANLYEELVTAVSNIDVDTCMQVIRKWRDHL